MSIADLKNNPALQQAIDALPSESFSASNFLADFRSCVTSQEPVLIRGLDSACADGGVTESAATRNAFGAFLKPCQDQGRIYLQGDR